MGNGKREKEEKYTIHSAENSLFCFKELLWYSKTFYFEGVIRIIGG